MPKRPYVLFTLNLPSSGRSGADFGRGHKAGWMRWLLLLLASGWFTGAWGEGMSDPTLPAPAWLAAQQGAQGAAAPGEQDVSSGVQLILIGQSRKFAMIDGQVIKPGDTYNGSKVVSINLDEVALKDASKSLKLTPDVEKKVITPSPLRKTEGASSKRKKLVHGNGGSQ